MTTDIDLDKLEADAAQAEQKAAEARATVRETIAAEAAERAERDLEWRRAYVATYDRTKLVRDVDDARAALVDALQTTPLGQALVRYLTAERLRYAEHAFAGTAAAMAGIDPGRIGYNPNLPETRILSEAATLLSTLARELAENEEHRRIDALQRDFEAHGSDGGRIDTLATLVEQHNCAVCGKFIEADDLYLHHDGNAFHNGCPKPQQRYTAEQIAESNAEAAKAVRWSMGYDS